MIKETNKQKKVYRAPGIMFFETIEEECIAVSKDLTLDDWDDNDIYGEE